MQKLKEYYQYKLKHLKMRTKIMANISLWMSIMSIGGFFMMYWVSSSTIMHSIQQNGKSLLDQYAINFETTYEDLLYQIYEVGNNPLLHQQFVEKTDLTTYEKNRLLKEVVVKETIFNKYVSYVIVANKYDEVIYWKNNVQTLTNDEHDKTIHEMRERFVDDRRIIFEPGKNQSEILISKQIINRDTLAVEGVIVLYLDAEYFIEALKFEKVVGDYEIRVINSAQQILIDTKQEKNKGLEEYFKFEGPIHKANWKLELYQSKEILEKVQGYLRIVFLGVVIIMLITTYVIFSIIINKTTKGIALLEKHVRKVEEGDYSQIIEPQSHDEVGLLSIQFNHMTQKINTLINEVYIKEIEKQKKQFEVLQAQINPHFLYNALGTIKWQANLLEDDGIEKYVDALIALLRIGAKTKNEYITIKDEIAHTRYYLEVQRYRNGNNFDVIYSIDEDYIECKTIKFILQPIVENVLFHGINHCDKDPKITILFKCVEDHLEVHICDNGVGMTEEKIKEVFRGTKHSGMNGVGINNVHERLQIYYGKLYGVNIESKQGEGTKVVVKIPIIKGEEYENI